MKKKLVLIVAVAVMALATGCGKSATAKTIDAAKAKTTTNSGKDVTSNKAQNAPTNAAVIQSQDVKAKKTAYNDFTEGDFTFSNITIEDEGIDYMAAFNCTMTYNGPGEIYVGRIEFKFYDEYGLSTLPQYEINQTLASGKSVQITFRSDGELWLTEKIEYMGQVK